MISINTGTAGRNVRKVKCLRVSGLSQQICLSFGSWVCILNNETALILKIALNFIFFALTLPFGFFIFENLNDYKIRKFFEKNYKRNNYITF